MLGVKNDITDPYFNLAAEEYFLKESCQEFLMLYINDPSVIIGKHQNAYAEINPEFIRDNNIKVVRRISGGGAVWHDHGNLNFSFIRNGEEGALVNFFEYSIPILDVLHKLGLNAEFKGKNSIAVDGLKVSGIAEHIYKNRVLHHGTLLFKSDLSYLAEALKINPVNYHDKAVKSVRSRTANISDFLNAKIEITKLGEEIFDHIMGLYPGSYIYHPTTSDHKAIRQLVQHKYSAWEWNYGYSPKYIFERKVEISGYDIAISLRVEKGLMTAVKLSGNIFYGSLGKKLESSLLHQKHNESVINEILHQSNIRDLLNKADLDNMVKNFF
jgi:lipoate-protein ligase A